jgi:hypothetical protein
MFGSVILFSENFILPPQQFTISIEHLKKILARFTHQTIQVDTQFTPNHNYLFFLRIQVELEAQILYDNSSHNNLCYNNYKVFLCYLHVSLIAIKL